jgi:hypothetical protein
MTEWHCSARQRNFVAPVKEQQLYSVYFVVIKQRSCRDRQKDRKKERGGERKPLVCVH